MESTCGESPVDEKWPPPVPVLARPIQVRFQTGTARPWPRSLVVFQQLVNTLSADGRLPMKNFSAALDVVTTAALLRFAAHFCSWQRGSQLTQETLGRGFGEKK